MATREIILKKGDAVSVTTEEKKGVYVYLTFRNGEIEISGNSAVVYKIKGYGMRRKVED